MPFSLGGKESQNISENSLFCIGGKKRRVRDVGGGTIRNHISKGGDYVVVQCKPCRGTILDLSNTAVFWSN